MNTITAYNKPLWIFNNYRGASTDEEVYMKNKEKLDMLVPYFSAHLCNAREHFFKHNNPSLGADGHVDTPSLGVFCSKNYGT